jgi:hypothetical protein
MREVRARLAAAGGPDPITEVGLPERVVRALVRAGIEDVDTLVARGPDALSRVPRLGLAGATAIRRLLAARGRLWDARPRWRRGDRWPRRPCPRCQRTVPYLPVAGSPSPHGCRGAHV